MKARFSSFFLLLLVLAFAQATIAAPNPEVLARNVISENPAEANRAVAEVRAMGPAGLDLLFHTYAREINAQVSNPLQPATLEWQRLSEALDSVSQQKNSYLSGLYWYTDLDQAKEAARATGKPILSLHLLGKLSEEFSCTNSRFFRTILYSNAEVSKILREHFILHWQSERPAPRVTIDFGDGRKLERTVTGNSIHYILDIDGRPIEAVPGVYGPQAFARKLAASEQLFKAIKGKVDADRQLLLDNYYREQNNQIAFQWAEDIKKIGGKTPQGFVFSNDDKGVAITIMPMAMSKAVTETSILRSITAGADALGRITDETAWTKIALSHLEDARLDEQSIGLIKRQTQELLRSTKGASFDGLMMSQLQKFQSSIALDTVRNDYLMHTKLYAWLLTNRNLNVEILNRKVYAELFLTPATDPWLGLYSPDVYTAIEGGGLSRN
ncbi:MAG TPA: hypothetical protein VLL54_21565 [Pyrinomonadaceae bacterium]|nr:hypothetical protein [Pyrinomonadaceae bacterium]